MTSNDPAKCCITGTEHHGRPIGSYETIGGYDSYVVHPDSQQAEKAILLLTDVLGHKFINAQLLADSFAANGYLTVVPDLFHGQFTEDGNVVTNT
jgi:dienelactone hydrolase